MTAVSHPAARRGSTGSLPAPDRPLPPEAASSCLLSLRTFSSFSKSDRSILISSPYDTGVVSPVVTALVGNCTAAADGDADPQPAPATETASPAASAATIKRRDGFHPPRPSTAPAHPLDLAPDSAPASVAS